MSDTTSSLKAVPDWAAQLNDSTSIKGLKIAVPKEYYDGLRADVKEVIKAALDHLESLGATVDEVSLPHPRWCSGLLHPGLIRSLIELATV